MDLNFSRRVAMSTSFPCLHKAWHAHQKELRQYLAHRLGEGHAADDLLQDVFVKALRQGGEFCHLENTRAWLFQVARNALVDHQRAKRGGVELAEDIAEPECQLEPVEALAECVGRILQELPEEDGDIIRQCDLDGVKQQAYADAHGLSLPATKSRLLRARQRMREMMTANCQVRFDAAGRVESHIRRS
jgi:RNA polymerase sigma-70 factor (ECF subfamily)